MGQRGRGENAIHSCRGFNTEAIFTSIALIGLSDRWRNERASKVAIPASATLHYMQPKVENVS